MQHLARTTGDYGLGRMIHSVHMTADVATLNSFYEDVFGALIFRGIDEPEYLDVEDRWASLMLIGNLCIESMAPNEPVDATKPVGKFYTKFGQHLHSVGFRVADLQGLGDHMIAGGTYIGRPGGGQLKQMAELGALPYFYLSPRITSGLMIELCGVDMRGDPRLADTWSSQVKMWENGHPLTIHRLAYVTLGVQDADEALDTYLKQLQAVLIHSGRDEIENCRYHLVQLGDCLLRLAEPLDGHSGLGQHVQRWGNAIYALTLGVRDLDSARAWLSKKGVRAELAGPGRLAANVEDCHGAPYFFSTEPIPNDPFQK